MCKIKKIKVQADYLEEALDFINVAIQLSEYMETISDNKIIKAYQKEIDELLAKADEKEKIFQSIEDSMSLAGDN
jgi:formiminotetrahydrofolate cyclodeaminase